MNGEKREAIMSADLEECFTEFSSNGEIYVDFDVTAEKMATKGYRRASDVVEEIFAEIEVNLHNLARLYLTCDLTENFGICDSIYEQAILPVKKKYRDIKGD